MSDRDPEAIWAGGLFAQSIPETPVASVSEWARDHVRLPGSARSERFDPDISPWTREVIDRVDDGHTRRLTFVKPVQCGGSVVGEVALCRWIATATGGDVQYNWEDDLKAGERWDKRIKRILEACGPVKRRWPSDRHDAKRGVVMFPHLNLTVQGVTSEANLDSDSIRYQVNEELHNWEPGRLDKAYRRSTAFWNSVTINISNAGQFGDQLHQAFLAGTQQHWEVKCPGCGQYHAMTIRSEKDKPGGLKYDSEGCKSESGDYDYNRLAPTIRYEFPCCGRAVRDNPAERRALSASGRYSEPRNPNAPLLERSYTLEAVSIDYIPWLLLIQEKHQALKAIRYGEAEPWKRYLQERECRFWVPDERPLVGKLETTRGLTMDRNGLADRALRAMTVDKQGGAARLSETPHYWVVIRDWKKGGSSRLVFEGKIQTDEDVETLRASYNVRPQWVLVDSGYATQDVYRMCARFGYTALKGEDRDHWPHISRGPDGKTRKMLRIYAPIRQVDPYEGDARGRAGRASVSLVLYSKQQIRNVLELIRSSPTIAWEVPSDVSDDYRAHMESEEKQEFADHRTKQVSVKWVKVAKRNDLFVCECYQTLAALMVDLIGAGAIEKEAA
ncbi:MAG: hypothetical protein E6Q97_16635 [Desulfurellales bacterium]|nr:MAG: hypothetical protein E6Q97_16635 [Desulfurellales bacterium]